MNMIYTILILCKDDALVAAVVEHYVHSKDIQVIHVGNDELLAYVSEKPGASLLLLDQDYPELELPFVLKFISPDSEKSILLLCGDVSKVRSIRLGRDDFVLKPCRNQEVVARVENNIARFRRQEECNIEVGQLFVNLRDRKVLERGREIVLTAREFDVLVLLARNPGRVFTKDQIYIHVWGSDINYNDRNLRSFVSKLRKKLEPDVKNTKYILTHWGLGYYFNNKL